MPIAVTVWLFVWAVRLTDSIFKGTFLDNILVFPGRGIIILLCLVTAVGYFAPKLITPSISHWWKGFLNRMPFVKLIYSSVKDIMEAFVGKQKRFGTPVLVAIDKDGIQNRLGFITSEDLSKIGIDNGMISVYIPISYGMFGELLIVPAAQVRTLDTSSAEVMKFIVSGGVVKIEDSTENQK